MPISIKNSTRRTLPKLEFDLIKKKALGESYELSLVFVGHTASRRLNKSLRGKDRPTNVLSFPLSKTSGEIFIDLAQAEKEHSKFDMNFKKFVAYLYIHGLLHLKGMEHGAKMEKAEKRLLSQFNF